jgi:hypothetical protein
MMEGAQIGQAVTLWLYNGQSRCSNTAETKHHAVEIFLKVIYISSAAK